MKYLDLILNRVPALLGKKFKYSHISSDYKKRDLDPSLDLLVKAGIVHKVTHTSAQGIPLGAGAKPGHFKTLFLDIALAQSVLDFDASSWILNSKESILNYGHLIESFVGQELIAADSPGKKVKLYYWHREARSSNAEVDYVICRNRDIVPVEVKSGSSGTLKSTRMFLKEHRNTDSCIRFWEKDFAVNNDIVSYPLYAAGSIFGEDPKT